MQGFDTMDMALGDRQIKNPPVMSCQLTISIARMGMGVKGEFIAQENVG